MTPAEREALKIAIDNADSKSWKTIHRDGDMHLESEEMGSIMCDMQYYPWTPGEGDWNFIAEASPAKVKSLLDLISTLELTLSNATRVGVAQGERIAKLEACVRRYHEWCWCQDSPAMCLSCKAHDALLAPPPEPIPEEKK